MRHLFLKDIDCVVIATDHSAYDWQQIQNNARLIVDTRHVIEPVQTSDLVRPKQVAETSR